MTLAVEMALAGDASMLRALLSTLVSAPRDRTLEFELPRIETAGDAVAASSAVLAACAGGDLSPGEAGKIMGLISTHVRAIEAVELAAREKTQEPLDLFSKYSDDQLDQLMALLDEMLQERETGNPSEPGALQARHDGSQAPRA